MNSGLVDADSSGGVSAMHDLTDDDRARLEKRYGSIEEIKRDFFPDLLAAERAAEKARRDGEPDELGDALGVVEAACLKARDERDEALHKLAQQSSGDQGLPDYTKLDPGEVRDFLDCHGEEAVTIGTKDLLETLTIVCPDCGGDFSGGGVDEPQPRCDRCGTRGRIPKPVRDDLHKTLTADVTKLIGSLAWALEWMPEPDAEYQRDEHAAFLAARDLIEPPAALTDSTS